MDLQGLVDEKTLRRLEMHDAGEDVSRRLRIAAMRPGDVGVLVARIQSVAPARTFQRKNGTEGLVGRVTLNDGTGEVDAVLWDAMNGLTRDGTLQPGQTVRISGVLVQEGWRGGLELGLEAAEFETLDAQPVGRVEGTIVRISDTQIVEDRFQADVEVHTAEGAVHVVVWDEVVKEVRALGVGAPWTVQAAAHPLLDGWFLAESH